MGNWLFNYHVRTHDDAAVRKCMADLAKHSVIVARAKNGWTTVFEQVGLDTKQQRRIARNLSARLATVVFTWEIADDDVTRCNLWDAGRHRLEFDSWPDYEGHHVSDAARRRKAGSPTTLLEYCVQGMTRDAVTTALRQSGADGPAFVMETERAHALAPLLGIDVRTAQTSFDDVAEEASSTSRRLRRIDGKRDPRVDQFRHHLWAGDYDVIFEWLRDGLDPNAKNEKGLDLVSDVLNARAWPVMHAFVEAGVEPERMLHWCASESAGETAWLLGRVTNIDALDSVGYTALLRAVESGNVDSARALIESGADVNRRHHLAYKIPPKLIIGRTALMTAARRGDLPMVELLLALGADRTIEDENGWTARDFAIDKKHDRAASVLD